MLPKRFEECGPVAERAVLQAGNKSPRCSTAQTSRPVLGQEFGKGETSSPLKGTFT